MRAALSVAAAMAVLALILTWPLGAALTSSLPGDYGKSLSAIWGIGWVSRMLTGAMSHPSMIAGFWNASIFHPEPQALAFSEPYIGQALLVWPLSWLSDNVILTYNTAFLLTFILTGLGTFLLVRALSARKAADPSVHHAATVAGIAAAVVFAFTPQRLGDSVGDLRALSIQWLPFALFGLHRYLATDSRTALALACAAMVALGLSSLAVLVGSAPLIAIVAVAEAIRLKRWPVRVWLELWAGAAGVILIVMAILLPYLDMQRRLGVPFGADFATPAVLVLSLLVGFAAGMLTARWPRIGRGAAAAALAGYLVIVKPDSLPIDRPLAQSDLAVPPSSLVPSGRLPAIYREVQALSRDAIVLELPFGDAAYDLRYLFFAARHGRRLVNGYAATPPASYVARQRVLANPVLDPERAVQALAVATHVIVHPAAWPDKRGVAIARQLDALGGTLIARHDGALLYQMQSTERLARRPVP